MTRRVTIPPAARRGARIAALLLAAALGACSGGLPGFGAKRAPETVVNPDPYPAAYRQQVVTLMTMSLHDRADFRGALIAPPALKPVANGESQHYVVCLQLTGHNERRTKAVIYLEGKPNEFVDATPQQCDGAAYQPFGELIYETPDRNDRRQVGSGDPAQRDVP